MKELPAIWFALILLTLLAALTYWIDLTVQPPPPKRDGSTRHDPDYIISNFTSSRTDASGNLRFSLAAIEMRHFPDNDSTELTRPAFTQFSTKKPTTRIEGQRGFVSSNGENVYFMDNVKVVRAAMPKKGEMTVLTEYLHIIPEQDFIQTDRPVTILQAPRTVIHAGGMEYNKKQGVLKLINAVKVHYERPDAPPAPPLTIEQVSGKKAGSQSVSPSKRKQSPQATKKRRNNDTKAQTSKSATNAGKTKTRIRRQYGNTAH